MSLVANHPDDGIYRRRSDDFNPRRRRAGLSAAAAEHGCAVRRHYSGSRDRPNSRGGDDMRTNKRNSGRGRDCGGGWGRDGGNGGGRGRDGGCRSGGGEGGINGGGRGERGRDGGGRGGGRRKGGRGGGRGKERGGRGGQYGGGRGGPPPRPGRDILPTTEENDSQVGALFIQGVQRKIQVSLYFTIITVHCTHCTAKDLFFNFDKRAHGKDKIEVVPYNFYVIENC